MTLCSRRTGVSRKTYRKPLMTVMSNLTWNVSNAFSPVVDKTNQLFTLKKMSAQKEERVGGWVVFAVMC